MSYNAIPLRPEDIDRRGRLYQKFKNGDIKPGEVIELRQILENELYLAITEGNTQILFSITSLLEEIDDYIKKDGEAKQ
jgi:uncharacterized protein (DUF1015 family)